LKERGGLFFPPGWQMPGGRERGEKNFFFSGGGVAPWAGGFFLRGETHCFHRWGVRGALLLLGRRTKTIFPARPGLIGVGGGQKTNLSGKKGGRGNFGGRKCGWRLPPTPTWVKRFGETPPGGGGGGGNGHPPKCFEAWGGVSFPNPGGKVWGGPPSRGLAFGAWSGFWFTPWPPPPPPPRPAVGHTPPPWQFFLGTFFAGKTTQKKNKKNSLFYPQLAVGGHPKKKKGFFRGGEAVLWLSEIFLCSLVCSSGRGRRCPPPKPKTKTKKTSLAILIFFAD